ncbi:hypothetical protein ACFL2D_02840 [Patescibacteria group bacterium]
MVRFWNRVVMVAIVMVTASGISVAAEEAQVVVLGQAYNGYPVELVLGPSDPIVRVKLNQAELSSDDVSAKMTAWGSIVKKLVALVKIPDAHRGGAYRYKGNVRGIPYEVDGYLALNLANTTVDGKPVQISVSGKHSDYQLW